MTTNASHHVTVSPLAEPPGSVPPSEEGVGPPRRVTSVSSSEHATTATQAANTRPRLIWTERIDHMPHHTIRNGAPDASEAPPRSNLSLRAYWHISMPTACLQWGSFPCVA